MRSQATSIHSTAALVPPLARSLCAAIVLADVVELAEMVVNTGKIGRYRRTAHPSHGVCRPLARHIGVLRRCGNAMVRMRLRRCRLICHGMHRMHGMGRGGWLIEWTRRNELRYGQKPSANWVGI